MLRWLTTNLRTFLLAFSLALAVWVTAVTAADPDETQVFPAPIQIEYIGQDPSLILVGVVPQEVEVTLRAPVSIWESLTSGNASVRAVVDLSGLGAGTHTVEVQLQLDARPVRVISISPRTFDLVLETLVTRSLPVELDLTGIAATGFQVGDVTLAPLEAVVSGPESLVNQVAHVRTALDITDARTTIDTVLALQVTDANGAVVSGVSIHPDSIHVSMPITQQSGYRDLAVRVVTVGSPAGGYRLTSVSAFPAIVTIYSENVALVASQPGYVETMPLNLSGAKDDIETNLALNLPAGVIVIGEPTVLVQVGIAPLEGSLKISYRPVEVVGLADGLTAQISPVTVDVILSGPLPVLDSLFVSDVRVRVDLTGLTTGTYQLTPVVVIAKEGVTVESILPGTVEVIIADPNAITPTPTP